MKLKFLVILPAIWLNPYAIAADSSERSSPQDANPACMDRNKDTSSPECTPRMEGRPRHYVKPVKPAPPPAKKPVTLPTPQVERSAK